MNYEKLVGGNMSIVFRNNDIIYRNQKPWSSTIHRFLLHLESEGFKECPRFLGIDKNNYEMLSYVEGECKEIYPGNIERKLHLKGMVSFASIMKRFHQASSTFVVEDKDEWMLSYDGPLEKEVICHNDIAPYNMTFKDDIPYKMIDFDTCCLAPRIRDIVYALYRFIPFTNNDFNDTYIKECITIFFRSYGMECPKQFFDIMIHRLEALIDTIYNRANNDDAIFKKMIIEGHVDFYLKEIQYIKNRYL